LVLSTHISTQLHLTNLKNQLGSRSQKHGAGSHGPKLIFYLLQLSIYTGENILNTHSLFIAIHYKYPSGIVLVVGKRPVKRRLFNNNIRQPGIIGRTFPAPQPLILNTHSLFIAIHYKYPSGIVPMLSIIGTITIMPNHPTPSDKSEKSAGQQEPETRRRKPRPKAEDMFASDYDGALSIGSPSTFFKSRISIAVPSFPFTDSSTV
jgi:hypothetical protein